MNVAFQQGLDGDIGAQGDAGPPGPQVRFCF